ncbi:MAG: DUF2249 domain-containing protein [Opitutaceae bacterium]|nr:DUF2249 domain-containing protein [Opitutaceae bacterium]
MINTTISDDPRFDVREIPCRVKHPQILQRWFQLPVGAHFVLVNDHDPVPLYYQFDALFPDAFTWEYLEQGPEVFQVKITKLAAVTPPAAIASPCAPDAGVPVAAGELDVRGLMPPEPMIRILEAAATLPAGGQLRARTDRRPVHLLAEIEARGFRQQSEEQSDGSWRTIIERA